LFLQAITGAHTLTCLLSRNRSRRNRDAPMVAASVRIDGPVPGASRANWLVLLYSFYANSNFGVRRTAASLLGK
jgi:hypothetical protein